MSFPDEQGEISSFIGVVCTRVQHIRIFGMPLAADVYPPPQPKTLDAL
jgi:hypothetical protein